MGGLDPQDTNIYGLKLDDNGQPKWEDSSIGEDNCVVQQPDGSLAIKPECYKIDNDDTGLAQYGTLPTLLARSQTQNASSEKFYQNPFFWGTVISSVLIVGLGVLECRRPKNLLQDILLQEDDVMV